MKTAIKIMVCMFFILPKHIQAQEVKISYLGNMGCLITIGDKKFIIDGVQSGLGKQDYGYEYLPTSMLNKLTKGEVPFNNVTAILVTHVHGDHFNSRLTSDFLKSNPQALAFVPAQAKDSLMKFTEYQKISGNIHYITPINREEIFAGEGYRIIAVRVLHSPPHIKTIQNIGYIIECEGISIFHVGDSVVDEEMYKQLRLNRYNLDVAILPFWLINSGKLIITNFISPEHILATHISSRTVNDEKVKMKESISNLVVFDQLLQEVQFEKSK